MGPQMARDAKIEDVTGRWAPRFISNGVPLTDYQEVTGSLETWEDWCKAWAGRAAVHEAMGREALDAGHTVSAAQHLDTAGVLYHFAKFVFVNDMDQLRTTHKKAVACRTLALPYLDPPGERVAIPYGGSHLYGILRKPPGIVRPPVVILCMGMDSAKEEMNSNEMHFLKRGMATLTFDGPGQGEGEYDFPITPEYEKPVGAVLGFIDTRDDIDGTHIGIWGVSFGGYYAPRALAYHPRIRACIAISGPFEFFSHVRDRGGLTDVFTRRSHAATHEETLAVAKRVDMSDAVKKITQPLFVVAGEHDTLTPPAHQKRLVEETQGAAVYCYLQGGNHCANNLRHKYSPQSADWMAGHLKAQ